MYTNPDAYSDYPDSNENPYDGDYAHPSYYQQDTSSTSSAPSVSRSAQPVQSLEHPDPYTNPAANGNAYDAGLMSEYRGPSNLDGYTVDAGAEQRDAAQQGKAEGGKKRKGLAGLGGIAVSIGALLLKLKSLAFLLKFGWFGISAVFSVVVYSFLFGWPFAIGLVLLLFIHEMGHALVMKLKGIPVGGLIFVPMLGAAVFMRNMPKNARDEAEVGIAGPFAGALASGVCLFLAQQNPNVQTIWAPLAYFGFFMNLFNLIPVVPFDGGRIVAAIDKRMWLLGLLGLAGFFVWTWLNGNFSIFLLLFLVMAATQYWTRRTVPDTEEAQAYYNVSLRERVIMGLLYFGLAAVLVLGMSLSHGLIFAYSG